MSALGTALAFVTHASANSVLIESAIDFANTGDNIIVPAVSGQGIYVFKYFLVVGAAVDLTFWDGPSVSGNKLTGVISLATNEAMVFTFDTRPWYSTTLGNAFIINASNSSQVSGRAYYLQG
jgi:hypothetical protein